MQDETSIDKDQCSLNIVCLGQFVYRLHENRFDITDTLYVNDLEVHIWYEWYIHSYNEATDPT